MPDASLSTDLAHILEREDYLGAGRNRLIRFREAGGTAREAREVLELMRDSLDGSVQDRVLELLDLASGFCASQLRIWPETVEVTDGSVWALKDPEGDLRGQVVVLGHETHAKAGPVVHVCVTGLESAGEPLPFAEIGHLPVSPQVFFESVRGSARPSRSDTELDTEGIEVWRAAADRGDGGVFGIGVADAVRFAAETVREQGGESDEA